VTGTRRVAAVGVGYSTQGRQLGLSSRELALQASVAAIADAGLAPRAIDGCALLWGFNGPSSAAVGLDIPSSVDIAYVLGSEELRWFSDAVTGPGYVGPAITAVAAIQSGLCDTVLTLRVIRQPLTSAQLAERGLPAPVEASVAEDDRQFTMPFGSLTPVQFIAGLHTQRYMHLYGATEEEFALHAVAKRGWASLNEDALFRDPLSVEDYLAARYISKPVRLLDCDYPIDSASAVVYTTEERARDLARRPVLVESMAYTAIKYLPFGNLDDIVDSAPHRCGRELWDRSGVGPADIDVAGLYDGFAIHTFQWLEALGFCDRGAAGPFVASGATAVGGALPVNTDGGMANVGRRHGANFCIEVVRQLRGDAGARQVPGAEVGVWTNASDNWAGAMVMTAG
jgi:acetyl-CoA acetyltransferase